MEVRKWYLLDNNTERVRITIKLTWSIWKINLIREARLIFDSLPNHQFSTHATLVISRLIRRQYQDSNDHHLEDGSWGQRICTKQWIGYGTTKETYLLRRGLIRPTIRLFVPCWTPREETIICGKGKGWIVDCFLILI